MVRMLLTKVNYRFPLRPYRHDQADSSGRNGVAALGLVPSQFGSRPDCLGQKQCEFFFDLLMT